jgi:uncharacterized membrane protein (UPF0127 family)
MKPLMKKLLMGLGVAGAGTGGAAYVGSRPYKGDQEVSNWSYAKTRFNLARALRKLQSGKHDVEVATGTHRAQVPLAGINEKALKYLDYDGTPIAIPERGQVQLTSYRKKFNPDRPHHNPHIHKHQKNWFLHIDKDPSLTTALAQAKTPGDVGTAAAKGLRHVFHEGLPGAALYLKNMFQRNPTLEEIMAQPLDEYGHRKLGYVSLPTLRPENSAARLTIKSATGEDRGEIVAEVVETQKTAAQGMSGFETMPENYGMLFKRANSFWMRDVNFDLDIAFADKYGTITETQRMHKLANPRHDHAPIYSPTVANAAVALELPAGWCESHNVKAGDVIAIKED